MTEHGWILDTKGRWHEIRDITDTEPDIKLRTRCHRNTPLADHPTTDTPPPDSPLCPDCLSVARRDTLAAEQLAAARRFLTNALQPQRI